MPHQLTRREFNRAAAAFPLVGIPLAGSDVSEERSQARLQVQCHRICVDGWHLGGDDWRLEFFVGVVQRKQSNPRYWYGRFMVPTEDFIQRLNDHAIQVKRHRNPKRLFAERVMLRCGVAGLCCFLEAAFPPDQQDDLWIDPTPERWSDYTVPDTKIIKKFWVSESWPM